MHIAILADAVDNQNAGVHVYTKNLIKNLLEIDKKNTYTLIHSKSNDFFKNTDHHIIPGNNSLLSEAYRRFFKIPGLIKKLAPDIVLEPCHIGPFRLPKHIKRAITIHDLTPLIFPQFHTKRGVLVHKFFIKKTIKNADLILTPSKNTKNDILKNYKTKAEIIITPLGVNTKSTTPSQPNYVRVNTGYILSLGTIEPRKNLETLMEAFLELKKNKKIPEHKLILAGSAGWKSKKILQKANHSDIILANRLTESEKTLLYSHADMFIYPSFYEGFGLPPLEAMSYGIPVICSNGGSLKEIFKNHALMFDPNDKEKLKNHILELTKNQKFKEKLSKQGKIYASTFTWEKTAQKTLKAFEEII